MDKLGKNGEVLLDYSIFDAMRAGFGKVVFIIRKDIEADFREIVLSRIEGKIEYELAFQELDRMVPEDLMEKARAMGRTKPWGTAHALLCAREFIDAPFTVLNADDFYGRAAFDSIGKFLMTGPADGAIVPYRLADVLSDHGTVARGFCEIENGCLSWRGYELCAAEINISVPGGVGIQIHPCADAREVLVIPLAADHSGVVSA